MTSGQLSSAATSAGGELSRCRADLEWVRSVALEAPLVNSSGDRAARLLSAIRTADASRILAAANAVLSEGSVQSGRITAFKTHFACQMAGLCPEDTMKAIVTAVAEDALTQMLTKRTAALLQARHIEEAKRLLGVPWKHELVLAWAERLVEMFPPADALARSAG